jgi:hypothetical protein
MQKYAAARLCTALAAGIILGTIAVAQEKPVQSSSNAAGGPGVIVGNPEPIGSAIAGVTKQLTGALTGVFAANSYYGAVIRNDTRVTLPFQLSVNNGPWTTYTIKPGYRMPVYFTNPVGLKNVRIRYDNTVNDGRVTFTTLTLKMWGCSAPMNGWLQTFILTNSGRNLFLAG